MCPRMDLMVWGLCCLPVSTGGLHVTGQGWRCAVKGMTGDNSPVLIHAMPKAMAKSASPESRIARGSVATTWQVGTLPGFSARPLIARHSPATAMASKATMSGTPTTA